MRTRNWMLLALASILYAGVAAAEDALEVVESKYVCMVSDAAYDEEQVRVDFEGKTYYGCCEMCKARLERNDHLRVAIDPVSGEEVDKAEAVIAADAYKRVYYFENEENLKEFMEKRKEKK